MTFLGWLKQQGKALVLQGPQGCGKGLLARQLAKEAGVFVEAHASEVVCRPSLGPMLRNQPKTVIVEGLPEYEGLNAVKLLISSTKLQCECKGQDPITRDTPTFIFCTHSLEPLNLGRRFYVVKMGAGA